VGELTLSYFYDSIAAKLLPVEYCRPLSTVCAAK
jgi:hypothetical protein